MQRVTASDFALVYALAAVLANAGRFDEAVAEIRQYVSHDEPQRVGLEPELQDGSAIVLRPGGVPGISRQFEPGGEDQVRLV